MNVPNRARPAGAYVAPARLGQAEALVRTCPRCDSGKNEWCVRVAPYKNKQTGTQGETPYPIRVKNMHAERFEP